MLPVQLQYQPEPEIVLTWVAFPVLPLVQRPSTQSNAKRGLIAYTFTLAA